ncbi:MAG: HlyD family efflux transporter periplasmic adaptor subunit, partial [Pseudomonadota bacterium]
ADWRPTVTMVHAALSAGRLAPAAAALAEALRLAHRCERVSVGTVEAPGRATVVAVSPGADGVAGQSLMDALAGAMEECAQAGAPVVHPLPEGSPPRRVASHLALARRDGLAMALSVPLASGTDVQGVLLLERRTPPFSDKERKEVVRLATLLAPAWALLQTLEQPWWQRWTQQARQQWGRSPAGRRVAWAGGAAALLAGLTALAVVPVDQRVSAPAHIEGTVQRALVAPTDGYLLAAHVRPGDTVRAGDLLAEMAREEMELQARKWNGELAQAEAGAGSALAGRDRAALVVQQARVVEAQAQLALSRQHLARSQVHAPFDGVVIEGDLSRSLGAPLKRGDVLLRVSPTDAYRLVLDVDERDVAQLRVGAVGQVVLAAHPGQRWPLQVTRITPVAAVRDGRVGYEVEASLPIDQPMLRPGLTGVAKIDIGQTPLAGQWWRDVAARVRYWAWSLTG